MSIKYPLAILLWLSFVKNVHSNSEYFPQAYSKDGDRVRYALPETESLWYMGQSRYSLHSTRGWGSGEVRTAGDREPLVHGTVQVQFTQYNKNGGWLGEVRTAR